MSIIVRCVSKCSVENTSKSFLLFIFLDRVSVVMHNHMYLLVWYQSSEYICVLPMRYYSSCSVLLSLPLCTSRIKYIGRRTTRNKYRSEGYTHGHLSTCAIDWYHELNYSLQYRIHISINKSCMITIVLCANQLLESSVWLIHIIEVCINCFQSIDLMFIGCQVWNFQQWKRVQSMWSRIDLSIIY
jgi:hypothetical protein